MSKSLAFADVAKLLESGANRVKENCDLLSRLDSATGDGDHGVTMKRTADVMIESIAGCEVKAIGPMLESVGWNVMSVDGGSTSPLLGSFFMGMAEAVGSKETLEPADLSAAFEAGLAKFRAQTPAKVGDKTMVDALVPAIEALRQAAGEGADIQQVMARAAEAAAQGAEGTKDLQAKFGRARNLGARTLGHVDPGATTISILFAGFRDSVAGNQ